LNLNFFSRYRTSKYSDFSSVKTDMHSHFIPCLDDGSQSMDESVDMIKKLYHLGYSRFITTPHIMADNYNNSSESILSGLEKLKSAVKNTGLPVEISAAGEYLLDDKFPEKYKDKNLLTFGKKYLLLELPFIHEPENFLKIVFDLQLEGYKVVLAHPERYSYWFGNTKKYTDLADREIFFQMNIVSLAGHYSKPVKTAAEWLIDNNYIRLIGTDAHNTKYIDEISQSLSEKHMQKLLNSGILLNAEI
jgi:protein-tyrosine phosphatase